MKLILVTFSIILFFISCKESKQEHSATTKETQNDKQTVEQKFKAYCYYKLDDKYSTEKDSLVINTWLKEKSLAILENDSALNIFGLNGGGINGSQKNPFTDLYIAIKTPQITSTETPKLFVNGKPYNKLAYKHNSELAWYVVDLNYWEQELKEIDSATIKKMYTPEFLNGIKRGDFSPNTDLKEGKVIAFDITHQEEKLTKFFYATYYE